MSRGSTARIWRAVAVALAFAASSVTLGVVSSGGVVNAPLPFGATYHPLPSNLVASGGVELDQLDVSQAATVVVTPAQSLVAAQSFGDLTSQPNVTHVISLGRFTDSTYKRRLASGAYGLVAAGVPSYVVTFSGLSLPTSLGKGDVSHESVIVNAATGEVLEGIKFY